MSKIIHLWDRSRTTTDWSCPRKRYWNYHAFGTGITKESTSLELYLGVTVHDALAAIATLTQAGKTVDIDEIALAAAGQMRLNLVSPDGELDNLEFAEEQACLVEGLIRGYYVHVWPRLMENYPDILAIEQECEYPIDASGAYAPDNPTSIFMSKPDLVLGNKSTGDVVYYEYKTTSSKREQWINSWDTAVQLHSTIRAISHTLGMDVTNVIVQGLYKGYESYGKQSSPFCYAYRKPGNPPFTSEQIRYDFSAGFKRTPVWELPGGCKSWVAGMPSAVFAEQFPQTPPIFLDSALIDSFFEQRAAREQEIEFATTNLTDVEEQLAFFEQKFDVCQPSYGFSCPYKRLCFGHVPNPLENGYVRRESHHAREAEQHANS